MRKRLSHTKPEKLDAISPSDSRYYQKQGRSCELIHKFAPPHSYAYCLNNFRGPPKSCSISHGGGIQIFAEKRFEAIKAGQSNWNLVIWCRKSALFHRFCWGTNLWAKSYFCRVLYKRLIFMSWSGICNQFFSLKPVRCGFLEFFFGKRQLPEWT